MSPTEQKKEKNELRDNIRRRLRRIEGQLQGIQRMIERDACCMDVLVQISAVRAAVSKVGLLIIENQMKNCLCERLKEQDDKEKSAAAEDLLQALQQFIR